MNYLVTIISLIPLVSFGQMLDNSSGNAFTDQPFFNVNFIEQNGIETASGYFMVRKPGSSFKNTTYKQVYNFNKNGELESQYETFPDDGTKDTAISYYRYDALSNLVSVSESDQFGLNTLVLKYDSLGNVIEERNLREYDTSDTLGTIVSATVVLNKETYKYGANNGKELRRTKYNSYNLPYLEERFTYNSDGYLIMRSEKQKMTRLICQYNYEYNGDGLLASIRKSTNRTDDILEEVLFEYDEFGNLSEKKIFRKGEITTDIQVIYDNKTGLLSSVISKYVGTGIITILRFDGYTFY